MGQVNEYVEEDYPVIVGVVTGRPREVAEAWEEAAEAEAPQHEPGVYSRAMRAAFRPRGGRK